jgi:hypothetical protein
VREISFCSVFCSIPWRRLTLSLYTHISMLSISALLPTPIRVSSLPFHRSRPESIHFFAPSLLRVRIHPSSPFFSDFSIHTRTLSVVSNTAVLSVPSIPPYSSPLPSYYTIPGSRSPTSPSARHLLTGACPHDSRARKPEKEGCLLSYCLKLNGF